MRERTRTVISGALSLFKYLIGLLLMVSGVGTMFADTEPVGVIYSHKWALIILGGIIALVGLWLILAKVFQNDKHIGRSLFAVYLCFLFAGILNGAAFGWQAGVPNIIASFFAAGLYLRWRYHLLYSQQVLDRRRRHSVA